MNEINTQADLIKIEDIQDVLDSYIDERYKIISNYLKNHLVLTHCFKIQKKHLAKDFFRNPINVIWSIPYFSIRKILEVVEKMESGWARLALQKIPKGLCTDYQKEIEQSIINEVFGFNKKSAGESVFEVELKKNSKLENISPELLKKIVSIVEKDIKTEVNLQCSKQQELTSLAASAVFIFIAHKKFGSNSFDMFGIGKEIAAIYAKKKAVSTFVFGKTLGRAYYNFAPPAPTSKQVLIATLSSVLIFSLLSSAIGVLSYPLQNKLGLTKKQLQSLIGSTYEKLIVSMIKVIRNTSSR